MVELIFVFINVGYKKVKEQHIDEERRINDENHIEVSNDVSSRCESDIYESDDEKGVSSINTNDDIENEYMANRVANETKRVALKQGQKVKYNEKETGSVVVGRILGRAGKATGKNFNWYNLEYIQHPFKNGVKESVDFGKVDNIELFLDNHDISKDTVEGNSAVTSSTEESVMLLEEEIFKEAKLKELESWRKNEVFEEVIDTGQKCVSTR